MENSCLVFCYVFFMVVCLFTVLSVDEMENKGRKGWSGEILPGNVKLEVGEARLGVPAEIWSPKSLESRCSGEDREKDSCSHLVLSSRIYVYGSIPAA